MVAGSLAVALDACRVAVVRDNGDGNVSVEVVLAGTVSSRSSVRLPLSSATGVAVVAGRVAVGGTRAGRAALVTLEQRHGPRYHVDRVLGLPGDTVTAMAGGRSNLYLGTNSQAAVHVFTGEEMRRHLLRIGGVPIALAVRQGRIVAAAKNPDGTLSAGRLGHMLELPRTALSCGNVWVAAAPSMPVVACNKFVGGAPDSAWLFTRNGASWERTFTSRQAQFGGALSSAPDGTTVGVIAADGKRFLLIGRVDGSWVRRLVTGIDVINAYQPSFAPDGRTLWLAGTGPIYRMSIS